MMKDDDFKLLKGFALGQTNERTDICDCRVAFATENIFQLNTIMLNKEKLNDATIMMQKTRG